jgi:glycosyltransferase involved in cell wall biosynthesis
MRDKSPRQPLFLAVNNIPTPYRSHLFESLSGELASCGVSFEAWFMASTERGRYWPLDLSGWRFEHRLYRGFHGYVNSTPLHFNPGMLMDLVKERPRWLLLGGSWHLPSTVALALSAPVLARGSKALLWSEANMATSAHVAGALAAARRYLYRRVDACVIPGRIAEETIRKTWRITPRCLIRLPNVVDEQVYQEGVAVARLRRDEIRSALGLRPTDVVVLVPARLHEPTKGVLNFLQAIAPVQGDNLKVLLAGDGPDRPRIEAWLARQRMPPVRVLGHQDQEAMIALLAASDALALPSFQDPNPLAVIEGLWAGLPLILSNACGNWPEAVRKGRNGWLVDPRDHQSLRDAVMSLTRASASCRRAMGEESRQIAEQSFRTATVARQFVSDVMSLRG